MAKQPQGGNGIVQYQGGGWYELPSGKKAHGRMAMEQAMATEVMAMHKLPSALTGRLNFLRQAGLLYKGIRDIYTAAGYIQEGTETFDHYWSLYERDPIAGRIVDMPAKTTWKTPPEVFEGEQEKEQLTEFEAAWEALIPRLKLWKHFESVDRLSRVGRYAVLFIGARDTEDMALDQEMPQLQGPEDILYLSSYAERYADIDVWEKDPSSPRFGLPVQYTINLSSGVKDFPGGKVRVHHSRIIHVAEDTLVDDVFGRPVLKRVLNALADMLKVTAATGEAYWQMAVRVLQAKIDTDVQMDDADVEKMGEALEDIVHDLRRQFVGQGVELSWMAGNEPKPSDALDMYKSIMGVGSGIPTRILFGSEQGQLASAQDERNYFGMVNERQEHHAEPNILRAFIDRLVGVRGLPAPGTEGYTVVWPALFELTEKELAEANLSRAQAAKALTPMGGDPRELVEVDDERNVWLLPSSEQTVAVSGGGEEQEDDLEGAEEEELEGAFQVLLTNLAANQTKIQTLIFPKAHWASKAAARKWARDHDFKAVVDETGASYRLRQRAPGQFQRLRTICLKGATRPTSAKCSIKAVVGPLKKK